MSDSLALNKAMASVLVCGIVFMVSGFVADGFVHSKVLKQTAIKIDVKEAPVAAAPGEAPLPPIAALLAKADPAKGEQAMQKACGVCHNWQEGGPTKVGPNLYGIVGAKHGHVDGFNYSAGLVAIKGPWTFEELNAWLHDPRSVVPGTRMSFAGLSDDKVRADVIDYLHTLSHNPEPLPAVTEGAAPAAPAAAPAGAAPAAKQGTTAAAAAAGSGQRTETDKAANATTSGAPPQGTPPSGNPAGH